MWFKDEKGPRIRSRRRSRNRRAGGPTLNVSARTRARKRANPVEFGRALVWPAGVALVLALGWLGLRALGAVLFSHNDQFTIRRLQIETDDVVALDYIREKQGIREGLNLFGFSARQVRREFLKAAPNYKSMEITRLLPDTLKIAVAPREPLARIGRRGGFVVDAEKRVFGHRGNRDALPVILGYRGPMLNPGDRVGGLAADAVTAIAVCRELDTGGELPLQGVDVRGNFAGQPDDLRLYLDGDTTVDLWWDRDDGESGIENLRGRLRQLRGIAREARVRNKRLKAVNLTLSNYEHNAPAEYWN